jgi:hypothetical protein
MRRFAVLLMTALAAAIVATTATSPELAGACNCVESTDVEASIGGDEAPEPVVPESSETRWAGVLSAAGALLMATVLVAAVVVTIIRRRRGTGLGSDGSL